jgi:tetratricopeptide (TPR) repeat protein
VLGGKWGLSSSGKISNQNASLMCPPKINADIRAARIRSARQWLRVLADAAANRECQLFPLVSALSFLVLWLFLQVASCQSSEEQIAQRFRAGQQAIRESNFDRAVAEFKQVLVIDPSLVEAEVNLGIAYHSLSDYELAVRHLTKALRARPNLLAPNVIVGMDYVKLGAPQKAVPFLQRALRMDPSNLEAHEGLASCDLGQQNFRGAAQEFSQVASLNPDKSEAWFKLGHEYLDLAARLAYRGAHFYPDSAWGHRFLGDLLFERNRWDGAAQEYRKALNLDAHQSGLHTSMGQTYLHIGKLQEAYAQFHLELQIDSANELAWLGLAELALTQGQAMAALDDIRKAWDIAPEFLVLQKEFPTIGLTSETIKSATLALDASADSPAKHFLSATLYSSTGESASAENAWKALQKDLSLSPKARTTTAARDPCSFHQYSACVRVLQRQKLLTDPQRLQLGKAQFALRQYPSAADAFGKVQGITKANAEASYWLSRTYQALGAESYTQLEESFPDSWRTHQLRAEGYELRQDLENARKELQLAIQIRPNSAELHEVLGNVYIEKHSDTDAEKELQNALALDSARPHALYLLGKLYAQAGENEKAIPSLQKAVRVQPDLTEANSLLGTTFVRLGQFKESIPFLEKAANSDHYGNVHYQLYVAYRNLGQTRLAQNALTQSQNLRRSSLAHDQALIMGAPEADNDRQ